MSRFTLAIVAVVIACFAGSVRAEGIREGKWTITVTTRVAGMESQMAEMQAAMENMSEDEKAMMQKMMGGTGMKMGPEGMSTRISSCVSDEDPVPQMQGQEGCQTTHTRNGDTVSFESVCANGTSTGEMTYTDDSMEGTITTTSNEGGEEMTIDLAGQYEGPCE